MLPGILDYFNDQHLKSPQKKTCLAPIRRQSLSRIVCW